MRYERFPNYHHERAPLNFEATQHEFATLRQEIARSIETHSLMLTPEEYWDEFIGAIQFIPFENYLKLIDQIIEAHKSQQRIIFYYPGSVPYSDAGPITNSDVFMIRLLKEVLKKRKLNIKVEIFTGKETLGEEDSNVIGADDATYTGRQKEIDMQNLPDTVEYELHVVASTKGAVELISKSMARKFKKIPKFNHVQDLNVLKDQLSDQAQIVFRDMYVFTIMSKSERPWDFKTDEDWKFYLTQDLNYRIRKPLVFNPFKLPDSTSTASLLLRDLVPLSVEGSYIDPQNLLFGEPEISSNQKHGLRHLLKEKTHDVLKGLPFIRRKKQLNII